MALTKTTNSTINKTATLKRQLLIQQFFGPEDGLGDLGKAIYCQCKSLRVFHGDEYLP